MTYYKPKERQFLEEYARNLNFKINKLEQENKILKMSLEEKDENCYSLTMENGKLKQQLEYYKTSNSYKDVIINLCLNEERSNRWYDIKCLKEKIEHQKVALKSMQKKNKSMKEDLQNAKPIMDQAHEWFEENLRLRTEIMKLKELQICGKTVAQWIEEDKKVVRE